MSPSGGDIISSVQLVPPPQLLIDKSQQKYNPVSGKPEDGGGLIVGEIPPPSLPPSGLPSGFHLDAPQFEPVGIDPFQGAEYGGTLMPSMDSPNFDYNQQVRENVYPVIKIGTAYSLGRVSKAAVHFLM